MPRNTGYSTATNRSNTPDHVQDTAWDNSRVVFNPTTKSVTSYGTRNSGTNTFPQLPGITHEMKTANETLNLSTSAYHNATNLANGRGDICRLIGLTQAEARSMLSAGTLADYRSGWRLPTDVESHDLLGRPANWSEIWVPSDYYITSFKDNEYAFLNTQAGRTALNTTQAGTPAQPKTISFPFVTRPGRPAFSEHLPLVPGRLYDGSVNYGGGFASALARSNGAPSIYISPYASSLGQVSLSPTDEYPAGYGFAIRCVRDLD